MEIRKKFFYKMVFIMIFIVITLNWVLAKNNKEFNKSHVSYYSFEEVNKLKPVNVPIDNDYSYALINDVSYIRKKTFIPFVYKRDTFYRGTLKWKWDECKCNLN